MDSSNRLLCDGGPATLWFAFAPSMLSRLGWQCLPEDLRAARLMGLATRLCVVSPVAFTHGITASAEMVGLPCAWTYLVWTFQPVNRLTVEVSVVLPRHPSCRTVEETAGCSADLLLSCAWPRVVVVVVVLTLLCDCHLQPLLDTHGAPHNC